MEKRKFGMPGKRGSNGKEMEKERGNFKDIFEG